MLIRTAREADLPAAARLFHDSVHQVAASRYDAAQRRAWMPQMPGGERWHTRLMTQNTLLADDNGTLAGLLVYADDGHIDMLFTAPGHTRRGVASALYQRAEQDLRAKSIGVAYTEASLLAHPFFLTQGFEVVEEQTVERDGQSLRRYAMRKMLITA